MTVHCLLPYFLVYHPKHVCHFMYNHDLVFSYRSSLISISITLEHLLKHTTHLTPVQLFILVFANNLNNMHKDLDTPKSLSISGFFQVLLYHYAMGFVLVIYCGFTPAKPKLSITMYSHLFGKKLLT